MTHGMCLPPLDRSVFSAKCQQSLKPYAPLHGAVSVSSPVFFVKPIPSPYNVWLPLSFLAIVLWTAHAHRLETSEPRGFASRRLSFT